jgi:hypothetical protein
MLLTEEDLKIVQRWFTAIETVAPEFLERTDWNLAEKVRRALAGTEPPKRQSK